MPERRQDQVAGPGGLQASRGVAGSVSRRRRGRDGGRSAGASRPWDGGSGSSTRLTTRLPAELFSSVSCLSLAALVGWTSTAPRALPTPPGNHSAGAVPGTVTRCPRAPFYKWGRGGLPWALTPGSPARRGQSPCDLSPGLCAFRALTGDSLGRLAPAGWGGSPQVHLIPGVEPELFPGETLISVPFLALPGRPGLGGADAGSGWGRGALLCAWGAQDGGRA